MSTHSKILQSTLLIAATLTIGMATAAQAGHFHPVPRPVVTSSHLPVWPTPAGSGKGGVVGGGGNGGSYDTGNGASGAGGHLCIGVRDCGIMAQ